MQGYVCAIPSNKTKYHTCRRYTFTFVAFTFVAIKCSPSLLAIPKINSKERKRDRADRTHLLQIERETEKDQP
jgi:hypothetical protein